MEETLPDFGIFPEISEFVDAEKITANLKLRKCKTVDERKDQVIKHVMNLIENIKELTQNNLGINVQWERETMEQFRPVDPQERQVSHGENEFTQQLEMIRQQLKQMNAQLCDQPQISNSNEVTKNIIQEFEQKVTMSLSQMEQRIQQVLDQNLKANQNQEQFQKLENVVKSLLQIENRNTLQILEKCDQVYGRITKLDDLANEIFKLQVPGFSRQIDHLLDIKKMIIEHKSIPLYSAISMQNVCHLDIIDQTPEEGDPITPQEAHKEEQKTKGEMIEELASCNDKGKQHCVIMQWPNGDFIVGGEYNQLILLDQQLKFIKYIDISGELWSGIAVGNYLYCYCKWGMVSVIDATTFQSICDIQIQNQASKMLLIKDDYLLIGQQCGFIDIIQLSTNTNVFKDQFTLQYDINDIAFIKENQYAFATSKGLQIATITLNGNTFQFYQQNIYFQFCNISCVGTINEHQLMIGEKGHKKLQMLDIQKKQEILLGNCGVYEDGFYNAIQRVIGYNQESFPYIIVKGKSKIVIINAKTLTIQAFIDCQYEVSAQTCSLLQVKTKDQLHLLTNCWEKTKNERGVKKYQIDLSS